MRQFAKLSAGKGMIKTMVLLVALMMSSVASATEFGLTLGFRSNNADAEATGASISGKTGMQLGGLGWIPLHEQLFLRTGFLYTQRYVESKVGTTSTNVNLSYLDIPVTFMYRFSEFGGAFFGPVFAMNQAKDCSVSGGSSSNCAGVSSTVKIGRASCRERV